MSQNNNESFKKLAAECEVKRFDNLDREFEKGKDVKELLSEEYELYEEIIKALPASMKTKLTLYSDMINRIMTLRCTYYYRAGLLDGTTLEKMLSGINGKGTDINITIV